MKPEKNLESEAIKEENHTDDASSVYKKRGQWANKWEFILAIAGEIIGLGNVWRFPYLCFKNGGGKKVIKVADLYLFVTFCLFIVWLNFPFRSFLGLLYFLPGDLWNPWLLPGGICGAVDRSGCGHMLEKNLSLTGRYFYCSYILNTLQEVLRTDFTPITPDNIYLIKGIGYGVQVIGFCMVTYYIIILAWAFLYLFSSFYTVLPWTSCNNTWNTGKHVDHADATINI